MNIILKTSTPLLVFRCLGAAPEWTDPGAVDHHRNFLKENLVDYDLIMPILEKYKTERSKLKFEEEGDLFEWVYQSFPTNSDYQIFLPLYEQFKNAELKTGQSIYQYFDSKIDLVQEYINKLETSGRLYSYQDIINKSAEIYPFSNADISLNTYIFFSPHESNIQGSATIKSMYVEVTEMRMQNPNKDPIFMILHEALHNILKIHNNIRTFYPENNWDEIKSNQQITEARYFDEAITFCISDIIIANKNMDEKLAKYINQSDQYHIRVITLAMKFESPIRKAMDKELSAKDLTEDLIKIMQST